MNIYDLQDNILLSPTITQDSVHEEELMKSNFIRLSWRDAVKIKLPVGAYIVFDGLKYSLFDAYEPDAQDGYFRYEPSFQHPLMILGRTALPYHTTDANKNPIIEYDWTIVDKPGNILAYICDCINDALNIDKKNDVGWGYEIVSPVDAVTATCSFSSVDILSGLSEVCNKFSTPNGTAEYLIDWKERKIYFGVNITLGNQIRLQVGNNIQLPSVSSSKEQYYNRFVIKGSTRNIHRKSVDGKENVSTGARLTLNPGKYPNGYIDRAKAGEPVFTKVIIHDDIYPKLDLYVYDVRERVLDLLDSKNKKIPDGTNEQGEKIYKKYSIWYIRLAYPVYGPDGKTILRWEDFKAPKGIVLDGHALKAAFVANEKGSHSALAGREFQMRYHETGETLSPNNGTGDTGVVIKKGDYEILFAQEGDAGLVIPTTSKQGLVPFGEKTPSLVGDKVVLFNIAMSDEYVTNAQRELESAGLKDIDALYKDKNNYSFKSNPVVFEDDNPNLTLCRSVIYDDGNGYELPTRVTRLITQLDYPFEQEISVGNGLLKGNNQTIKEDIKNANENINILNRLNSAVSAKAEAYSRALREIIESFANSFADLNSKIKTKLSRKEDDSAEGVITFLKGLKFGKNNRGIDKDGLAKLDAIHIGEYVEGVSGAALKEINGQTYLEVDRAYFRQKAVFESLEVMKTEYSFGNRIAGKGGIKVTRVEEQPNAYRCYFLHEQDGLKIENPFVLNDQAIVREVNIKAGTTEHAANHFLWRTVVAVGENYVDLSKRVCASGSDKPLPGDALCQLGYRGTDKPDRQCAIMERTVGEDVPAYVMLQGINDFTLEGKDILSYGWDATKKRAYMKNYGETYVGSRDRKQFIEYTPENGLRVNAKEVNVEVKGQPTNVGQTMSEIATKTDEISLTVKKRKFGGVNLLKGTSFEKLPQKNTGRLSLGNDPAVCHSKRNYIKASASGFSSSSSTGIFLYASQVEKNTEYTYSVWVRVDDLSTLDAGLYFEVFATKGADGTRVADIVGKFLVPDAGKWVRVINTFTTPDTDFDALEVTAIVIKNGTAYFSEPQLEVGNVPTDWSENPDDVKDQIEEAGVKIKQGLIELNGKSVFKNGNAPAVPLFDENGKVNPKLSTAQYLMNVLRNMETMIDGGLVIAGLMAAKDGEQVTAYLNGLRQKTHALAAGVKNFGTENETTVSHINFDGSAKFGNLGISADGRVNIIDAAGKPRINITPDELPSDDELLKTADEDKTYNLPGITLPPNGNSWNQPSLKSQTFNVSNDRSAVLVQTKIDITSYINSDLLNGRASSAACWLKLKRLSDGLEETIGYYGESWVWVRDGVPDTQPNVEGDCITDKTNIVKDFILGKGTWQVVLEPRKGENVHDSSIFLRDIKIDVSFKSGRQNFSLAHNGFASVNSNHQAAYIRDGKLHAFGEMNIPGILLAGTVNHRGYLSNAWGEFVEGTSLQYTSVNGVAVIRITFNDALPCGSNYVAVVTPNELNCRIGSMAVVRNKTDRYCEFRVVEGNGNDATGVGFDFMIIGKNK